MVFRTLHSVISGGGEIVHRNFVSLLHQLVLQVPAWRVGDSTVLLVVNAKGRDYQIIVVGAEFGER